MWCIHKVCCFQFLTLVLFAWTILDIVKASQNDTVKAIDAVAGNNTIQHINCTNGIQLNGQLFDVADNDTDDSEIEIPLSEQLFEFAQLFSLVNFKSNTNQSKFIKTRLYTSFEGMPKIGPRECHHITAICIRCIEPALTSNQWHNA